MMHWLKRLGARTEPFRMPPQPDPADTELVDLLNARDGLHSVVVLADGLSLTVVNVAWGYDMGEDHAHVMTNASPDVPGQTIGFFRTGNVVRVLAEDGSVVYERW